jgi:hypothetical protein
MVFQIQSPVLKTIVSESPWATRAWTYQEAILSPRCLYFTTHQIYFECNLFQCRESVDTNMSPGHNTTLDQIVSRIKKSPKIYSDIPEMILSCGVNRSFAVMSAYSELPEVASIPTESWRWSTYAKLAEVYSKKVLTYDSDALNAITAILTKLQESGFYPAGFHWGLPLDRFEDGIKWNCVSKRKRRDGIPSWSWLGWYGHTKLIRDPLSPDSKHVGEPVLSAWKVNSRKFHRLAPVSERANNNRVSRVLLEEPPMSPWILNLDTAETSRLLVLKGYVLWLPIRNSSRSPNPFDILRPTFERRLFNFDVKLSFENEITFSRVRALGRERAEHLCVLRLTAPESHPGLNHRTELLILDQARIVSSTDNSLIAVHGGWFGLEPNFEELFEEALKVHQELRTVYLQ